MKTQSLLSAFDALLGPAISREPPRGYLPIEVIAKHHGLTVAGMYSKLTKLVRANKVERKQFRSPDNRLCWAYRVK